MQRELKPIASKRPTLIRIGSRNLKNRSPKVDMRLPTTMREPILHFTRHTLNAYVAPLLARIEPVEMSEDETSTILAQLTRDYRSLLKNLNAESTLELQMQIIVLLHEYFSQLQHRFIFDPKNEVFSDEESKQTFNRLINSARLQLDKLLGILNGDPYRQFPEKVDLTRLVGNLIPRELTPNPLDADDSSHYSYRAPPNEPVFLFADQFDAALVFENLFSNAIRSCRRKGIFPFIEIRAYMDDENPRMAHISVKDPGIGFRKNELTRIKYNTRYSSKEEGPDHGFGLQHCRFLIEQHGGILEISSQRNQGAEIMFTLPAYASEE